MTAFHLLHSRLTLQLYLFNDKMKWQYWSYSEVVGKDCTEQESLWILGGERVGELPTLSLPLLASPWKSHPSLYGFPEPHKPLAMLTAQTPPSPLPVPFHPLAPKPSDLCYHLCLSHLGPYWFLLVPCLLQLPPNFWLPGPPAGFSHSSLKFSPCLLPNYFLSQIWLCYCQVVQSCLVCSVLLSRSSNLHFSIPFDLRNPDPLQILFLREGHYFNYQSSCLRQKTLLPKMPFKIWTLCYRNWMLWKVMQHILSSDEAKTLCMLSRSLPLCFTKSKRQKHCLISFVDRHTRGTSKLSLLLAVSKRL